MGAYQLSYIDLGEGGWGSRGFAIFLASDGHLVAGSSLETVKEFADKVRQHEGLAPSKYGTYSLRELYSIRMFSSAVAKLREIARNG